MERAGSNESTGSPTANYEEDYNNDDDGYTHEGSFGDGDSQEDDDSDILDEDTYNFGEENIFDVDFPHEQDELIRSNTFAAATQQQKPIPRYSTMPQSTTFMRRGSSASTSRYETDESNDLLVDRRSQPSLMPPNSYHNNSSSNSSSNPPPPPQKLMARSSSGLVTDGAYANPYMARSLTMDTLNNNDPSSTFQQQRRLPLSPTSITTPNSARFSFSSTTTSQTSGLLQQQGVDYNDMEDFVKLHRAEIRTVTEYAKRESKLVATISLQLSSNRDVSDTDDDDDEKRQPSAAGQYKSNQQFRSYLQSLDAILDEKMAAIGALRDTINDTMSLLD